MPARAALLSLVLAGPGLAAPPVSPLTPEADNAAILAAIDAADPAYATNPAPVEHAVSAARLAEQRLAASEDPEAVAELLMLAGAGRRIAAQRVPAAAHEHLCAMLADAEQVQARALSAPAADVAAELKGEALAGLKGESCTSPEPPPPPPPPPNLVKPEPPAPASTSPNRRPMARLAVGGSLVGLAGALAGGMVASLVGRRNSAREVDAINAAYLAEDRPPTDVELAEGVAANARYERRGSAALALGLTAGASLAVGLAVMLARPRAASRARLRAASAGLVYSF